MSKKFMQWIYILAKIPRQAQDLMKKLEPPIEVSVEKDGELENSIDAVRHAVHRLTETLVSISAAGGGVFIFEEYAVAAYLLWTFSGVFLISSWVYRYNRD